MEIKQADKNLVKHIKQLIDAGESNRIKEELDALYAQDIAEIINGLPEEYAKKLVTFISKENLVKVLVEMDDEAREKFLQAFSPKTIADEFILMMDSDDAAYILSHFNVKEQEEIISNISDIEYAGSLLNLLNYEEGTAGSIMAVELVKVNQQATVQQCIDEVRAQAENVDNIYVVYVVDDYDRLVGYINLKTLLISKPTQSINSIIERKIIWASTSDSLEDVANLTKKYDLIVVPVVDALGRLVGRITIDDVVDVIKEEANEDYQLMSGITEDVDATDKVWILTRARLPWLLIGMLGGIASSRFIEIYEDQLRIHPEMAFFMPLIAAMGGNVGVQSSAIVVQGLANDTFGSKNIVGKIFKELRVALLNGIICSSLILSYNVIFNDSMELSLTVSIALITVIIFASLFGTFIPMFLNKVKIDPALATGPFITTTNDLIGIAIYFSIGRLLYGAL
ncbi:MAG: magnesium transporter [Bacteroidia bacterium]